MIVGVPKEIKSDEYRVAMVPAGVEDVSDPVALNLGRILTLE